MASPDLTGQVPADHAQVPTNTPSPAPESLVLSAHTLGILARHIADRLGSDPSAAAFTAALDDVAGQAAAWVRAQLDALDTTPQSPAQAFAGPLVAPTVAPVAPPAPQPATDPQPLTATAAVLAATTQLGQGATARNIAAHVAAVHALDVTPETVRAIQSKHRRGQAQPTPQPLPQPTPQQPQHGTGMYL